MSHEALRQGVVGVLIAYALAGCGGGGGGGGGSTAPPATFTVGGSISGLVGSVTLQNAGGAQLSVSANGSFTFGGSVAGGASYSVTVAAQPDLQSCTVANGSGAASANVTNIAVTCADAPPTLNLSLQPIKAFRLAWSAVPGVTHYALLEDATGNSGFAQVGADIGATVTSLDHVVPLYERVNARYFVQACSASRCIDSNAVSASGTLAEAVGYFKAASIGPFDQFGESIALSGDGATLAVGVPADDSNATGIDGNPDNDDLAESGAVYVFVRDGGGAAWVQQAYIKASIAGQGFSFGQRVALDSSGATLAATSPIHDGTGAAYVFERVDGVWTEQGLLKAANPDQSDFFGESLALSSDGKTLAVGALFEDSAASGVDGNQTDNSLVNSGAAYVFVKDGPAWRQDAYVKASNPGDGDRFGSSVALSADGATLAVGARGEDSGATGVGGDQSDQGATNSGAVYVFTHGAQWAQQAYIKASNTDALDDFGQSLALSADGSTLAVGADGEDSAASGIDGDEADDSAPGAGAVFVFSRLAGIWTRQAYIKASDTFGFARPGDDFFGTSLALSANGSVLAVGAPGEDSSAIGIGGDAADNSAEQAGAAYVFVRSRGAWAQRAYVKQSTSRPPGFFGGAVALSGDGASLAAGAILEEGSVPGINGDQSSAAIEAAGAVYLY